MFVSIALQTPCYGTGYFDPSVPLETRSRKIFVLLQAMLCCYGSYCHISNIMIIYSLQPPSWGTTPNTVEVCQAAFGSLRSSLAAPQQRSKGQPRRTCSFNYWQRVAVCGLAKHLAQWRRRNLLFECSWAKGHLSRALAESRSRITQRTTFREMFESEWLITTLASCRDPQTALLDLGPSDLWVIHF